MKILLNRLMGLGNTTRSRSGRLLPMADGAGAPAPCRPRSQFAFFSGEPASALPWPPPRLCALSSCPPLPRSRMAMNRPAWVVSIMACSWNYPYLPIGQFALHNLRKTQSFLAAIFCRGRRIQRPVAISNRPPSCASQFLGDDLSYAQTSASH